jgi:hypothetical protein
MTKWQIEQIGKVIKWQVDKMAHVQIEQHVLDTFEGKQLS